MEISNKELSEFLLEFNKYLTRTIKVVAVGGTALTLLGKKSSTKDVDFCFPEEKDRKLFVDTALKLGYKKQSPNQLIGNGIIIDTYVNGYIFVVQLPDDYLSRAIEIRKMEKINLYSLDYLDIIITKTARLNKRDDEDIRNILSSYKVDQNELVERYILTMEHSMVRDAKDHLIVLFSIIKDYHPTNELALKKAEAWSYE
ncbi:MAG: nucleotidyltransferase [Candidatus Micrarchaeota archaeon]|nr:nucleotidyltransferase [Candidatus Micrarchaeota archaeon]